MKSEIQFIFIFFFNVVDTRSTNKLKQSQGGIYDRCLYRFIFVYLLFMNNGFEHVKLDSHEHDASVWLWLIRTSGFVKILSEVYDSVRSEICDSCGGD